MNRTKLPKQENFILKITEQSERTKQCLRACLHECGRPRVGEVIRLTVIKKIARISDTILQIRDAGGKFLDIVMALVILTKQFKMSLWRRMVKRYQNNHLFSSKIFASSSMR